MKQFTVFVKDAVPQQVIELQWTKATDTVYKLKKRVFYHMNMDDKAHMKNSWTLLLQQEDVARTQEWLADTTTVSEMKAMQFNQQKDIVLHLALQVKLQFFVEGSETNCREMVALRHSRYKDLKEKVKTLLNLEGYDISFFMCGECRDECKILSDCGKVMVKPIVKELAEEALVQMIDEDGFTAAGKSQSNTDLAKECKSNTEKSESNTDRAKGCKSNTEGCESNIDRAKTVKLLQKRLQPASFLDSLFDGEDFACPVSRATTAGHAPTGTTDPAPCGVAPAPAGLQEVDKMMAEDDDWDEFQRQASKRRCVSASSSDEDEEGTTEKNPGWY